MPVFGPLAIRKMFPEMQDLISQLVLKLDRLGPDNEINPSDDFTIRSPPKQARMRLY
jgi:cytochrome P450/NADPH-cytochrome P450 reductase